MASVILGQPVLSGAQTIISGQIWTTPPNIVGVQFFWYPGTVVSGNAYLYWSGAGVPATSGGPTITSGGLPPGGWLSGQMDGMALPPNTSYFVPRALIQQGGAYSGVYNVAAYCDPGASGVGRLFFDVVREAC